MYQSPSVLSGIGTIIFQMSLQFFFHLGPHHYVNNINTWKNTLHCATKDFQQDPREQRVNQLTQRISTPLRRGTLDFLFFEVKYDFLQWEQNKSKLHASVTWAYQKNDEVFFLINMEILVILSEGSTQNTTSDTQLQKVMLKAESQNSHINKDSCTFLF